MKTKISTIVALLFLFMIPMMSFAQTYDKLWEEVENARRNGLPKTAIKYAEDIYRKAEKEKNSGQMLKAYTTRSNYRQGIDRDSFYVDVKGLEKWVVATKAREESAILHTLIAKIYSDYASQNQYNLWQRTVVLDTPSEDMREWSRNIFANKVVAHTRAALDDPTFLFGLNTKEYSPFVVQRAYSRYFNHNTYHLLASYAINSLSMIMSLTDDATVEQLIAHIYSTLDRLYRQQDNKDALILLAIEKLQRQQAYGKGSSEDHLKNLHELIKGYGDREVCAELYLAKAQLLFNHDKKAEALETLREALAKFPKYDRINALKNLEKEIMTPYLSVSISEESYPGDSVNLEVHHLNLDGFTMNVYKVNMPGTAGGPHQLLSDMQDEKTRKAYTRKVDSKYFTLKQSEEYRHKETILKFLAPKEGIYLVEIIPNGGEAKSKPVTQILSVTRLKILTRALPDKRFEVVTLDSKTGHPVADATVYMFGSVKGDIMPIDSMKSGANGRVEMDWNTKYEYIAVAKGTDNGSMMQWLRRGGYSFSDRRSAAKNERIALLTDRSLYRPGQTVYLKGVVYTQLSDTADVVAGEEYTVTLYDANNREVSKQTLRTNEFGSFATEFILPTGGLNGDFSIRAGNSRTSIRVEEYKLPTFEVVLDKPTGSYKLGDTITLKGIAKTYSGAPMEDIPVEYVVTRELYSWWRFYSERSRIVTSGTATLNSNGEFTVPVTLEPDSNFNKEYGYYSFIVSATVTNVAGETQTGMTAVAAGNRSLLLDVTVPGVMNKDDDMTLYFRACNLNRQSVSVKGEYKLYPVIDQKSGKLAEEPIDTGVFTSNESTELPNWKTLPSGVYKLKLSAKDEQGREATYETETTLFSLSDKRPAKKIGVWYYKIQEEFDGSEPAEFIFGTSEKDAYVMMDVFAGNKRLESRSLQLSDSIVRFTYPYKEEYGDGLNITFCYVKDGNCYLHQVTLKKKMPDKELNLKWSVFRDKLRPGQQEEWKLTIRNPDNTWANAELLAAMYDASLDQIWKRGQSLRPYYYRTIPSSRWDVYHKRNAYYGFLFEQKMLNYPDLHFDSFWMDGSPVYYTNMEMLDTDMVVVTGFGSTRKSVTTGAAMKEVEEIRYSEVPEGYDQIEFNSWGDEGQLPAATAGLRTNFAETAFCYPQLRTNKKGEVVIAFTMPENLTRWVFNGYAHTKGMLTGVIEGETQTSKEFMLTPNLPRFVRVGDKTSVAVSVANLTEKEVKGDVVFTLFDPLTEKVIGVQKQKFTAGATKTVGVNFTFTATDKYDFLGCRLVAEGGGFSDGEQHMLPVLSNKERIIETVAMPIRGNETREFALEGLFNNNSKTATGRSLTVEYSGNPAWYAVQALPSLSMPDNDNAISWATTYYANSLAAYIMHAQPRMKDVFDAWKKQGGTKETFMSNLQKNQDVKAILLEESPWVMEATTEQEQKERVATLFEINNIQNNNASALNKLKELQHSDGSWPWYKGMKGSRYVTGYVLQQLVRLRSMTGLALYSDAAEMGSKAFGFLHRTVLEEYQAARRENRVLYLDSEILQYLYLVAISGEKIPEKNKTAYNYFVNKIKDDIATMSITQKATAAIILQKAGRTADANAFIASLKEYLTQTDEQGMFFAFTESPYTWTGLRVPAHVTVMEALDLVGNNATTVEEMKLWLLKKKQTQKWSSPVATADAVYALLHRGTNLLSSQGNVRITLGGKVMEALAPMTAAIPGISYVKETITDKNELANMKKAVVEKRDAGIAWGAVYAQYEEDIDKVTSHGEGLQVEKVLYVEKVTGKKKELVPVKSGSRLNVGDRVVSRVTIKLDRTMDFVQLKDQRGACFEPIGNLSGYVWNNRTGYYVAVKDASTNFYFDSLNKGVYVLEHSYRVSRAGTYESGLAVIQSAYAPEYAAHSASVKVNVD